MLVPNASSNEQAYQINEESNYDQCLTNDDLDNRLLPVFTGFQMGSGQIYVVAEVSEIPIISPYSFFVIQFVSLVVQHVMHAKQKSCYCDRCLDHTAWENFGQAGRPPRPWGEVRETGYRYRYYEYYYYYYVPRY